MDICENDGAKCWAVVDYYSRYITAHELTDGSTAEKVINKLEGLFCLLGVPNTIVSDNGPPFGSEEMRAFC
jgi:transposase InsO family protein